MVNRSSFAGVVMRSLAFTGLLVALATGRAVGQRLPTPFHSVRADYHRSTRVSVRVAPEPGIHSPLLAAAGLGLLGWGIGAATGIAIEGDSHYGDCCPIEGIIYGGAAGGGLGLAVGAHLGNRRRGSFLLDLLTSGAVWGAGYGVMRAFSDNENSAGMTLTAIVLPPTQYVATVLVERASGRSRARRTQAP
jgi:hypothetical protein